MLTDRYYYNRLSSAEKTLYSSIYGAIVSLQASVILPGRITMPTLSKLISAMSNDNPHLYYFNQTELKCQTTSTSTTVFLQYFFTASEIQKINKQVETAVNTIISKLSLEKVADELEREKEYTMFLQERLAMTMMPLLQRIIDILRLHILSSECLLIKKRYVMELQRRQRYCLMRQI